MNFSGLHRLRTLLGVGLLLAVLWTQTLGVLHRVLHAQPARSEAPVVQVLAPAGVWHHLWTPVDKLSDADCLSYDQLVHGANAPVLALIAPQTWTSLPTSPLDEVARVADPALFDARGPPAVL